VGASDPHRLRFCVLYFGLYVLMTQMLAGMLPNPKFRVPVLAEKPPVRPLVLWVGNHLLGVKPTVHPTGSGDNLFDWTYAFTELLLAALGTVFWSVVARRTSYPRLYKWFRLFIRVALGTTMFTYGFAKVFPLQMPTVFLSRLLEPYGDFSPMGVRMAMTQHDLNTVLLISRGFHWVQEFPVNR